jgi:hypothetical protein
MHYAVKANPYALARSDVSMVDGFDTASAGELGKVAHLGLPISFAGPASGTRSWRPRSAPASLSTWRAKARQSGRWRFARANA